MSENEYREALAALLQRVEALEASRLHVDELARDVAIIFARVVAAEAVLGTVVAILRQITQEQAFAVECANAKGLPL